MPNPVHVSAIWAGACPSGWRTAFFSVGAAILMPVSEITRVLLGHKGTGVDMMIYGNLITLISVYQPKGVWGLFSNIGKRAK
jgi:ABC-type branched-subunit amino acid transport system permease subunit